jgi:hypothetical protein
MSVLASLSSFLCGFGLHHYNRGHEQLILAIPSGSETLFAAMPMLAAFPRQPSATLTAFCL